MPTEEGDELGLHALSLREAGVVRLVAAGLSDDEIAEQLAIAAADVRAEVAAICHKLGLRSRTELAFLAAGETRAPGSDDGAG